MPNVRTRTIPEIFTNGGLRDGPGIRSGPDIPPSPPGSPSPSPPYIPANTNGNCDSDSCADNGNRRVPEGTIMTQRKIRLIVPGLIVLVVMIMLTQNSAMSGPGEHGGVNLFAQNTCPPSPSNTPGNSSSPTPTPTPPPPTATPTRTPTPVGQHPPTFTPTPVCSPTVTLTPTPTPSETATIAPLPPWTPYQEGLDWCHCHEFDVCVPEVVLPGEVITARFCSASGEPLDCRIFTNWSMFWLPLEGSQCQVPGTYSMDDWGLQFRLDEDCPYPYVSVTAHDIQYVPDDSTDCYHHKR